MHPPVLPLRPKTPSRRQTAPHVVIVGGGISGLAAAEQLRRAAPSIRLTVLESAARLGGMIGTERSDGFVMERGPDVFLAARTAAVELCERIGIAGRLQGTDAAARGAYILHRGRLTRVPEGLTGLVPSRIAPFALSPLLSPAAKLRVALEYAIPPRRGAGDESVESFVVRRLGRQMYERLVEPLLTGIYAGDGAQLSIEATFPQLREYEREQGGLLRGMLAARRGAAPARGGFLSFPLGLEELIEGVHAVLARPGEGTGPTPDIRLGARVTALAWPAPGVAGEADATDPAGILVRLARGGALTADAVILATSAAAAGNLLAARDEELAQLLHGIGYASTATVTLAYRSDRVRRPLDATGYVVPRSEGRQVLACTWSSAKFQGRAPAGRALFRVFLGGAGRDDPATRSEADLTAAAVAELRDTMGVTGAPELTRVTRWERALPQYTLGHADRIRRIEERVSALPGLSLAGNAYHGVGIPDCIRSGQRAAESVLSHLGVVPDATGG